MAGLKAARVKSGGSKKSRKPKGSSKLGGAGNCGTGPGGFKPGNTCGKGGRAKLAADLKAARKGAKNRHEAQAVRDAGRGLRAHRRGKADAIDDATAKHVRGKLKAAGAKAPGVSTARTAAQPIAKPLARVEKAAKSPAKSVAKPDDEMPVFIAPSRPGDAIARPAPAKSPDGTFGKSKAEMIAYRGQEASHEMNRKIADGILGKRDAHKDIPSLIGAPDDATVTFNPASRAGTVQVIASSSQFSAARTIRRDSQGRLVIKNDHIRVRPSEQGKGVGSEIFGRQVEQARAAGVDRIETHAARGPEFNGYYTWARLGYDAGLKKDFQASLPANLKGAKKVSDLMMTPEGRAHWKDKGYDLLMIFDLKPGSRSNRVHDAYMAEKRRRSRGD